MNMHFINRCQWIPRILSDKPISLADASLMTKVVRSHLTNVKSEVQILQKDPNSPLYSAKTFQELNL